MLFELVEAEWLRPVIFRCVDVDVAICGCVVSFCAYDSVHLSNREVNSRDKLFVRDTDYPAFNHGARLGFEDGSEVELAEAFFLYDVEGFFFTGAFTELAVVAGFD